jgi:hypothetical protein
MKKVLALIIAVVMLAAMAPMAWAANASSITIAVPEIKGLTMTLTNVQDKYSHEAFMYDAKMTPYFFYFDQGGTVSFSKKVTLSFVDLTSYATTTQDFEANKPITVDDKFTGADLYYDDATTGFIGFISLSDTVRGTGASACSLDINTLKAAGGDTTPSTTPSPSATTHTVVLSSQAVKVDGVAKSMEVYNIDGSNYFKLRDIAYVLNGTKSQFSVSYDDAKKAITCTTGAAYTANKTELVIGADNSSTAVPSTQSLYINGSAANLTAFNIGGSNFIKLRDMGTALNFTVNYDEATKTMLITSAK